MKLSDILEIQKPTYTYLKITPDTSTRNYNSISLLKSIHLMQRSISSRIKKEKTSYKLPKYIIQAPVKVSYFIDISKSKVDFILIVPSLYKNIALDKITDIWKKATVEEVPEPLHFSKNAVTYQLSYSKEDSLSLNVDKKSNEPLNNILNVIDILEDTDRLGVVINFMPINSYGQLAFKQAYNKTMDKIKKKEPIERNKLDARYVIKTSLIVLKNCIDGFLEVFNDFLGSKPKQDNLSYLEVALGLVQDTKELSNETRSKKDSTIIDTQMLVLSDSIDQQRANDTAIAVCQSFRCIDKDNSLLYMKLNKNVNNIFTDYDLKSDRNKMSLDEASQFIQIPGRDLLNRYHFIKKIETQEVKVPEDLQSGIMCIGSSKYKDTSTNVYLSNDREYKNLTLTIIGPTRAGKSTLIQNLSRDSINNNECTIIFDFCKKCELSSEVAEVIDKDKVLVIDCASGDNLQGMGYNEAFTTTTNNFDLYVIIKMLATQLSTLVNSVNVDKDLTGKMDRYLEASAMVVFSQRGSIKDVFDILQDVELRNKFISSIPNDLIEYLKDYCTYLNELTDKKTGDNKTHLVQGILDRINKFKKNAFIELMLKKDTTNNINLLEEIQKNQLICLRMPDRMFATEEEKDIYSTYWITKIWLALQLRGWNLERKQHTKVNIVVDELYQVPNTQDFIKSKLSQMAKYTAKVIISCHYLNQISIIRNELKSANSSYMLISGCDKDNFSELKEEFTYYGFCVEDLLAMKRYHSLNLIKSNDGWFAGITKLPKQIKKAL